MGKKKCQAGINKNASYWEWMVLPGKKEGILHFVWEKQRKEEPNCFIKVLTYIQLKSLNLRSQMTHILAFLWKENYFPHGWLSNTMSLCRELKEHQHKKKILEFRVSNEIFRQNPYNWNLSQKGILDPTNVTTKQHETMVATDQPPIQMDKIFEEKETFWEKYNFDLK